MLRQFRKHFMYHSSLLECDIADVCRFIMAAIFYLNCSFSHPR